MLLEETFNKIQQMRMPGFGRALQEQLDAEDQYDELSFEERLGLLVDQEERERETRLLKTRLTQAKLRQQACMEDIDYRHPRGLNKSFVKSLMRCQWIKDHLNIIITGATGTGKTYLACALDHRVCLEGYRAYYVRVPRLFQELSVARGEGRYENLMRTICKRDVLITDDGGLSVLTDHEQRDLLEILEDRHDSRSTIIAGQLPVKHWYKTIGNATLADAILDRLVHQAYQINLKGESMRKRRSKLTEEQKKG
ncbi:MAG: IS21-like element helper ATPase IstB [Mariprofundaceae bacterium]|nr:IS21-like element helper ATPase IstB [Mariprofundaceae bacterium]